MITKIIQVTQTIEVTVDETKFTDEFMREYREYFYDFDDIDDHLRFLASQEAQGFVSHGSAFIEGYGPMNEMGISFNTTSLETDVIDA